MGNRTLKEVQIDEEGDNVVKDIMKNVEEKEKLKKDRSFEF